MKDDNNNKFHHHIIKERERAEHLKSKEEHTRRHSIQ